MIKLIEVLNCFGQWLIEHLWQMSTELLLLAVVVAAVIFLFRIKSPTLRHLFYGLILAKPIITFLIASPVSLYWFLHSAPAPEPETTAVPVITYVRRVVTVPDFAAPRRNAAVYRQLPVQMAAAAPSIWETVDNYGICAAIWLLTAFALSVRFMVGFVYVWIIRRRARILHQGSLAEIFKRLKRQIKTFPRARLGVVDSDCGPVLTGILFPLILLPRKLSEHLSEQQLKLIIAHELIHVRRMDNLVLVVQRLAEIFLFFHPVVWICGNKMRSEAEAACDGAVLRIFGSHVDYADSLTRVAEIRENLPRRMLVNTFAAAESDFSRRIKRIMRGKPVRMTLGVSILSVIALMLIAFLGLPASSERKLENKKIEETKYKEKGSKQKMENKVKKQDTKVWIENVPSKKVNYGWTSMLQAMKLVIEYYGEKTSLDELMVYSGDAFNLCHATNWELRIPLSVPTDTMTNLAKAYGFDSKWTDIHFCWSMNKLSKEEKQRIADKYTSLLFAEVASARPVLFGGARGNCGDWRILSGYDRKNKKIRLDGGEIPHDWTDLIDPKVKKIGYWDMQVRGAIKPGFYGGWAGNATFIPGKKGKAPSEKQRTLTALKQAVEIFNAPSYSTRAYGDVTYYFGGEAYRQLSKNLKRLDYPADLKAERAKGGPFGFYDVNNLIMQTDQLVRGRTAAAKLCERAARLLPESEKMLLKAAENYRQEAALAKKTFSVFLKSSKGRKDKKIWRDAMLTAEARAWLTNKTNREQGAKAVLQMLKYEQQAIVGIEKALKTERIEAKNIKSVNKKIIAGVPPISWQKTGDCSFAAALSAALAPTEHPYSYADIMGCSALAFRVRWRYNKKKLWCPSIPVGEFPEEQKLVSEMTGWQFSSIEPFWNKPEKVKEYISKICESINRNLPVVGYPTMKNVNCGVIYGYEMKKGQPEFYWRDLFKGNKEYLQPAKDSGPWFMFLKSWKRPPSKKQRLLDSMQHAVVNWTRPEKGTPSKYAYTYGGEAMTLWIKDIENSDKYTEKECKELFFCNWWNFSTLTDARENAVKFLKENLKLLPEKSRKHLKKAVELYQKEYQLLVKCYSAKKAFFGPWSGKKFEQWTQVVRKREVEILSEAFKFEQQAIAEIEAALKAEGVDIAGFIR